MENLYNIAIVLVVVVGWIVTNYFNKRHEITKRQIEFRIDMLQSIVLVKSKLKALIWDTKNSSSVRDDLAKALEDVEFKVNLFGNTKELELMKSIRTYANKSMCLDDKLATMLLELIELARNDIRKKFRMR